MLARTLMTSASIIFLAHSVDIVANGTDMFSKQKTKTCEQKGKKVFCKTKSKRDDVFTHCKTSSYGGWLCDQGHILCDGRVITDVKKK